MPARAKLGFGLGMLAAFALLLVSLRSEDTRRPAPAAQRDTPTRTPAPAPAPARPRASAPDHDAREAEPVEPEPRDHTGEPLSDGPAKTVTLPERPEGAEQTTPSPEQRETALTDVITRLDAEIAAAHASGDAAEAERLTVRRDRLLHKLEAP